MITSNRRASHDYHLLDRIVAGIQLQGSEIKSIRDGKANLVGAHVLIENGEAFLYGCDIAPYVKATLEPHDPKRPRRLLLNKKEIRDLHAESRIEGKTIVALDLHWKNGKVKVTLATAKGKNNTDKREALKKKAASREIEMAAKKNR